MKPHRAANPNYKKKMSKRNQQWVCVYLREWKKNPMS